MRLNVLYCSSHWRATKAALHTAMVAGFAFGRKIMSSLNVDSAIGAHRAWKGRLEHVILGIAENKLDPLVVSDDAGCLLGTWLFGSGQEYSGWSRFDELVDCHRHFHQTAGAIVLLFHEGKLDEANGLLDGDFSKSSNRVVALLTQLREHLNAGIQ